MKLTKLRATNKGSLDLSVSLLRLHTAYNNEPIAVTLVMKGNKVHIAESKTLKNLEEASSDNIDDGGFVLVKGRKVFRDDDIQSGKPSYFG